MVFAGTENDLIVEKARSKWVYVAGVVTNLLVFILEQPVFPIQVLSYRASARFIVVTVSFVVCWVCSTNTTYSLAMDDADKNMTDMCTSAASVEFFMKSLPLPDNNNGKCPTPT